MKNNSAIPIGGYVLVFVHTNVDGSKHTLTRFIKKEQKDATWRFMSENSRDGLMQEEVIDGFLNNLNTEGK